MLIVVLFEIIADELMKGVTEFPEKERSAVGFTPREAEVAAGCAYFEATVETAGGG